MVLDIWRFLLALINFSCLIALSYRYIQCRKVWEGQTRNLWATLMFWALAGVAVAVQGMVDNAPFSARLVFITIASMATPITLRKSF